MLPSLIVISVKVKKIEPKHSVYTHYLGSTIYKTTRQHASLVSMPFSYKIGQKDNTSYGLRLSVSLDFLILVWLICLTLISPMKLGQ
jgi:hypothetical protein